MMPCLRATTALPELVEGLSFLAALQEGQGFDGLSLNGFGLETIA